MRSTPPRPYFSIKKATRITELFRLTPVKLTHRA
jgi:hypothetical protein